MKDENASWLSNLAKTLQPFLVFLFVLFLPTQLGKHFWPSWSYVLGQRIDYLSPTLYVTDIIISCLFLTVLFTKKIRIHPLFSFSLLFFSLSIFLSESPYAGWYFLVKFLEFSFVVWFFAHSIMHKKTVGYAFALGIVGESFLALSQYLLQHSLGGVLYFLGERSFSAETPGIANASINGQLILRPYGTFSHPNVLAGYLVVGMLILTALWMREKTLRTPLLVVLMVGTCGLALTLSRVAIVSWFLVGIVSLIILSARQYKKIVILFCCALCLGGVSCSLVFPTLFARLFTFSVDESVIQRVALSESAIRIIEKSPFVGVGPNNFLPSLPTFSQNSFLLQPVHNIFLLIASETGVIGLGLFLSMLAMVFKRALDAFSLTKRLDIFSLFLALSVIVFTGLFDHYWLTIQQGQLLFAFVIGLLWMLSSSTAS